MNLSTTLMQAFQTHSLSAAIGLTIALLFAGFAAAVIDSVVGGGGIISLPSLLAAGVPPHLALGTNKMAGTFASGTSGVTYIQGGKYHAEVSRHLFPLVVIGAAIGAFVALHLSGKAIRFLVLLLILGIGLYTLFKKQLGQENHFIAYTARLKWIGGLIALLIGFYDGFLGPGTGTFFIFLFLLLFKFDFITAAGNGRILNFASNFGGLVLFILTNQVVYLVGLPMGLAMAFGARVGVKIALSGGIRYVKPLFVVICFAFVVKLSLDLIHS